jgi:tyrosyl-tRNA synthetase
MYQFLLNSDDNSVIKYLNYFTFLTHAEIAALKDELQTAAHLRSAQKKLAEEVVLAVHGEAGLASAIGATKIFFGEKILGLKDKDLNTIFKDVPSVELKFSDLEEGILIADLLALTPLFGSKGEAKRSLEQKGVYLNNDAIVDLNLSVTKAHLASETCIVIRKGKKNYCVVKFI